MNIYKREGGFTLLELLVVVAIIGILTSVVVVMTSTSRKKSQDSSIKSQLLSLRSQAELLASNNGGSYATLFTGGNQWASGDTSVQAILTGINKQTSVHTAGSSTSAWAAQAQLKLDSTQYLCMDSTLTTKTGAVALVAGATVCP